MTMNSHKSGFPPIAAFFCAFLSFASMTSAGTYSGGSGTPDDPYQISTVADWQELIATSADWEKYFALVNDIDFAGVNLMPVAPDTDGTTDDYQGIPFTGVFEGNGHILCNGIIDLPDSDSVGLFGAVGRGGKIRNVHLVDLEIHGRNHVGGLAGENNGTLTSSSVTGSIEGIEAVGGLVGNNYITGTREDEDGNPEGFLPFYSGRIIGCYAVCFVTGQIDVGGLTGWNTGGIVSLSYAGGSVSGQDNVGGLVGYNWYGVMGSFAIAEVFSSGNAGGLIGKNWGLVSACFWDREICQSADFEGASGLTTAEMKDIQTYLAAGWDFNSVWQMPEGDYPLLRDDWKGPYSGGTGSEQDPYLIHTTSDWQLLTFLPSDWDKAFSVTGDLDFQGIRLNPIGICNYPINPNTSLICPFVGRMDGSGYDLKNASLQDDNGGIGVFGNSEGYIRNLGVENFEVVGSNTPNGLGIPTVGSVGGLIGFNMGTIEGCHFSGRVQGGELVVVGGLVGHNRGKIRDCSTSGFVSGILSAGGLVGTEEEGTTTRCHSDCEVSGTMEVGGLVGQNRGSTITECFADGIVFGEESIGGLAGFNRGGLFDCWSQSVVEGTQDSIGGLVGSGDYGRIYTSYATGKVIGPDGAGFVGGLVGKNLEVQIESCFWDVETTGQTNSAGGVGKTTAEMKNRQAYQGWGHAWTMRDGQDYPHLTWENAGGVTFVSYSGGQGTQIDPYQIRTAADWKYLILRIVDWDKHFILTADIDLSGIVISPVGRYWIPFIGSFNGLDHVIRNADINLPDDGALGLFGQIGPNGLIRNLGVENVKIIGYDNVGGLVGCSQQGTIISCYVSGSIGDDSRNVGGLIGVNDRGTITDCYATGSVRGTSYVGGLAGYNSSGTIAGCHAESSVIGTHEYVGGLVGENYGGTIHSSYAAGEVFGDSSVGGCVGGNVPSWETALEGTLLASSATGSVTGSSSLIGGLCGINRGVIGRCSVISFVRVEDYSFNIGGLCGRNETGKITLCDVTAIITGGRSSANLGGLCGWNDGQLNECSSNGSLTGGDGSYNLGGLCGYNEGSLVASYSLCDVVGGEQSDYLGGLTGSNYSVIDNCYARGSVTGYGFWYLGGLCGSNWSGQISNSYSAAVLSGEGGFYGPGGLCATNLGTIRNCFWDVETSGQDWSDGGEGKTTAEIKTLSTFTEASWDFVGETANGTKDVWRMCADDIDYPRLSWEFSQGGDLDCPDGIAMEDLVYLAERWIANIPEMAGAADVNGDGRVGIEDFAVMAGEWMK